MGVAVAVVDAHTPGNVGTIARAMKNFGFSDLKLVDPPDLHPDGEAYGFAGHAREDVLPNHDVLDFEQLVSEFYTIGFTAMTGRDESTHVRYPFRTSAELGEHLSGVEGDVALVFGREGTGLSNEEFARIDEVCSIPASSDYPVLNLGQAATIALYELRDLSLGETHQPTRHDRADERALEGLYDQFASFLVAIDRPAEKRAKTERMLRRVLGRAHPTGREVTTLRGLFRRAELQIDRARNEDS
jgi:tRNA (cytidine32/uridine32-2'-O)-methyltransferase